MVNRLAYPTVVLVVVFWFAASAQAHSPEVLLIVENGKYGYIDKTGRVVIEPQFTNAGEFSEGLAYVEINDLYGFIDTTGSLVIPPQFDEVESFSEGRAAVSNSSGKWGFIDRDGK